MVPPRSGPPKRPLARTVASTPLPRYPSPDTGSQDPKDVSRDTARDLSALAALKGDAHYLVKWVGGPRVPATVRYNAETRTAILDPSAPLQPDGDYTPVVEGAGDGDMKAVKDKGGTPLASDYTWRFYYWTANP